MAAPKGNQNANTGKRWRRAIERALERRAGERGLADAQAALDELAEKLLNAVELGDLSAIKELGDRIDGKAVQAVEVDGTIEHSHEHRSVSDTARWIAATLGVGADPASPESLPH